MENINDLIKECVYGTPLVLLSLIENDKSLIKKINDYLPYSTGFEIECAKNDETFILDNFKNIPNILDVDIDNFEQRFRIPSGINGLICLYNISNQLKYNSTLNEGSGIHYHVDMTECYKDINDKFIKENSEWLLIELESWEYKGNYNTRGCGWGGYWVRYNTLQTIEFRIGEMTFDYELLVKRIIHSNSMAKRLKKLLNAKPTPINVDIVTTEDLIKYNNNLSYIPTEETLKLKAILSSLKEEEREIDNTEESEMNKIIKQRVVKL